MEQYTLFYPEERIALFIDGANLYAAARALAFDIDYKRRSFSAPASTMGSVMSR